MNILDLLILLPIAFFAYRGFKNGLIREVLGIVGIVLGVFLAFRYMDEAGAYIQPFFGEYVEYVPFVAAFIIFIGTLVVVNVLALMTKKVLDAIQL
ncbi:MAG TPA: CvpA family protein, partial [Fodinibius sp.]|nr:CvpA family protein [Fodinibius sp.]